MIKIHLQIHKLEEIHEVNKNSNLNLMFGFFEKTLQILILHTCHIQLEYYSCQY